VFEIRVGCSRGSVRSQRRRDMRYVTIECVAYCVASCREANFRLTYEVRPLRDGLESWFLISMVQIGTATRPRYR
jgi:hypothetical protein